MPPVVAQGWEGERDEGGLFRHWRGFALGSGMVWYLRAQCFAIALPLLTYLPWWWCARDCGSIESRCRLGSESHKMVGWVARRWWEAGTSRLARAWLDRNACSFARVLRWGWRSAGCRVLQSFFFCTSSMDGDIGLEEGGWCCPVSGQVPRWLLATLVLVCCLCYRQTVPELHCLPWPGLRVKGLTWWWCACERGCGWSSGFGTQAVQMAT